MSEAPNEKRSEQHPTVTEHPEQKRQEETGQEDPAEASEVGRAPSGSRKTEKGKSEEAA